MTKEEMEEMEANKALMEQFEKEKEEYEMKLKAQ